MKERKTKEAKKTFCDYCKKPFEYKYNLRTYCSKECNRNANASYNFNRFRSKNEPN